jgi:restriction system protein
MKLKMAPNSLFAVLLRSPWWASLLVVAGIVLVSGAVLPKDYAAVGMVGSLPFLVIGVIAAWRQSQMPDPARVADALNRASTMAWRDFSVLIESAFSKQGYTVERLEHSVADFRLTQLGAVTLVSCKRWKAANPGTDGLRDLAQSQESSGAQHSVWVSLAEPGAKAQAFAKAHGIRLLGADELAQLVLLGSP